MNNEWNKDFFFESNSILGFDNEQLFDLTNIPLEDEHQQNTPVQPKLLDLDETEFIRLLESASISYDKRQHLLQIRKSVIQNRDEFATKHSLLNQIYKDRCIREAPELLIEVQLDMATCLERMNQLSEDFLVKMIGNSSNEMSMPKKFLGHPQRKHLYQWFIENLDHPYPTKEDKKRLTEQTQLTEKQVNSWFINMRIRYWKPLLEQHTKANSQ